MTEAQNSANAMSILEKSCTASVLLRYVAQVERARLIRDLLQSLKSDDQSGLRFVASLVEQDGRKDLEDELYSYLADSVEVGRVQVAVDACLQIQQLCVSLLGRAAYVASEFESGKKDPSWGTTLRQWLLFASLVIAHSPWTEIHTRMLLASIQLLHSDDEGIHSLAKRVISEVLSVSPNGAFTSPYTAYQADLWTSVQYLLASRNPPYVITAYSLWLRWIISTAGTQLGGIVTDDYWQMILHGLRYGDAEQRKLCLNILKLTVGADAAVVSIELSRQYDRFATVFENIVLGRYMNQVLECKQDLDFFASASDLGPPWLFALLGAALSGTIQDTIRRFVGNWAMHSNFKSSPELMTFFRDGFLPWAIQGQHFVASLEHTAGRSVCRHGQQLSAMVKKLREASNPGAITNVVVDAILRKHNSMFAYCTVFLLEGLGDSLSDKQKDQLKTLHGLPEVARDYVMLKIASSDAGTVTTSARRSREQEVLDEISALEPNQASLDDLWSDLEYLEFPKRLLLEIPSAILDVRMLDAACNDVDLATSMVQKLETLQQVATSKTFLFPPLAVALREAAAIASRSIQSLDLASLIIKVTEQPPQPTVDLMLEEAIMPLTPYSYEHYYGERLSYGYAAFLDLVSRLRGQHNTVKTVLDHIMHRWRSQKVPPPVVCSWKNALQLQVLLLCFEQHEPVSSAEQLSLLEDVFYILAIEPLPNYRYLLEAIVVRMIMRYDVNHVLIARLQTKDHHSNPKHLASLMKIAATLACTRSATEQFVHDLATAFVPLAASSKVVIRHEAQWQVPILMDHARHQNWTAITGNTALMALDDYIRSLERFQDPPHDRVVGSFDPTKDHTMTNLVEGRWLELDKTESPLASHADFVRLCDLDPLLDDPPPCLPLGPPVQRPSAPIPKPSPESNPTTATPSSGVNEHIPSILQTKGTANLAHALSLTLSTSTPTRPSPHLLIVASLIDNPHNLGGLSRVAEIFGAGTLTLPSPTSHKHKDFISVAVSSHLHIPLLPLPSDAIAGWLRTKRRDGYIVVGIEQTSRSVVLGSADAKLPEKCVLVVGNERTGVPGDVLVECEMLVEIEQRGVTRSLNVQTAVACVGFEYCRQHGKNG